MQGYALFALSSERRAEATELFQESITAFTRLTRGLNAIPERVSWYKEQISSMRQSILDSADENVASHHRPQADVPANPNPASPAEAAEQPIPIPHSDWDAAVLQLFIIRDEIPAGQPLAIGYDRYQSSQLEIEQVIIEGQAYRIRNLRSASRTISLKPFFIERKPLVTLKVKGDSMNQAGIDPGDFVLISLQRDANPGDIVVAQIAGLDTEATLKRYWRSQDGHIILKPESDNPDNKDIPVDPGSFEIRGITIAVFKPI